MTPSVQEHYGATDIVARILAAVPWSHDDGAALTARQVFPFDQLHGRELLATQEHAARLNPTKEEHLLDIGSGVGGPARYFASTFGCRITGIDLTPDFILAAKEISTLCNLGDLLSFVEANAAKLPFAADTFDHAYSFYVGMNLADKSAVLSECFRVLKPGGRLLWTEVTEAAGNPHYPLPWSRSVEGSHVQTREILIDVFATVGFEVLSVEDETGAHLELAQQMKLSGKVPTAAQQQANEVVLGADFGERRGSVAQMV
ncbi:Methyltransferase domain-containing protein [Pseudorhodobacter antarcticus]|uniref:Methyltransferase domain-containing protein n=1 Tax=Pseudorhodobacter antarcticus TaxID=1077947 RepID=A0A1H8NX61_9RHOB|nr:class I SAM-dependent methyltransferase [Pseudorhodobacter antarcticus]SEO34226.1 Methyltransferase domain-containing protein [Pseudorhodobacter antarcticus]